MITDYKSLKDAYVYIYDLEVFGLRKPLPRYHPEDPRYIEFWSYEMAKCIEGIYGKQETPEGIKYRFMPGNLYFYGKYTKIQTTNIFKETEWIKPLVRTLEWELAYYMLEARGFSGWEFDDQYTSDSRWFEFKKKAPDLRAIDNPDVRQSVLSLYNSEGKLKEYLIPERNIKRLQDKPLGRPLLFNEARNAMVVGSRGGGKSYYFSLAENLHRLLFDGSTTYSEKFLEGELKCELAIGSAKTDKSSDFCQKIIDCLEKLAVDPELGAWGNPGDDDYHPSYLHRYMTGSIKPNNKDRPFSYEYEVLENGVETTKGTGSRLFHVNYSENKKDGAQQAAGGRYNLCAYEEVGLMRNIVDAWTSNKSTVMRDGIQFGIQAAFGTSGNIEYIQNTKKMMLDPKSYNIVDREDVWEQNGRDGRIGFFLTYLLTLNTIDRNGNTIWEDAVTKYNIDYKIAAESLDPKVLRDFKMNHPVVPSHMWTSGEMTLLPYEEALQREKELLKGNKYKELGLNVKLYYDETAPYGISYKIDHKATPITQFPIDVKKMEDPGGCVVIYEPPEMINGVIPPDLYNIIPHDPYVAEELDKGGSVGVTYIIKNPKYIPQGVSGNIIVASYIGKPLGGLKEYYGIQEKLIALYGNPPHSLWYESVRGDYCRGYYIKQKKQHILNIAPQIEQGSNIYQKNIVRTGFNVGNKISKLNLVQNTNDWLLEETTFINKETNKNETKRNIYRIPCIFLVRQIAHYDLEGNFDAVSCLLGGVLGLREYEASQVLTQSKQKEGNRLAFLSTNEGLFSDVGNQVNKFNKKYNYEHEPEQQEIL